LRNTGSVYAVRWDEAILPKMAAPIKRINPIMVVEESRIVKPLKKPSPIASNPNSPQF
jgi:hypothetical protein